MIRWQGVENLKDKIDIAKRLALELMEKETMSREEINDVLKTYYDKSTN